MLLESENRWLRCTFREAAVYLIDCDDDHFISLGLLL